MEDNNQNPLNDSELKNEAGQQADQAQDKAEEVVDKAAARKAKVIKEIREWVVALVVAVLVVVVIQSFLFRIIRVDGHSMDTTLADGERLFVTVADIKFGDVQRGSVVICHYPNRGWTYFVKRCVAIPGDTVYRENGVTHVVYEQDGQTVDEMLDERYGQYYIYGSPDDYEPYVLGDDEYFVVGDNRYNSHDSRRWNGPDLPISHANNKSSSVGPITKGMITGHVRYVFFPFKEARCVENDPNYIDPRDR